MNKDNQRGVDSFSITHYKTKEPLLLEVLMHVQYVH